MPTMTRRALLSATATAMLGQSLPFAAEAAVPQSTTQAPSFYRYKLGDYEVTVLSDGVLGFPVENFVVNAKADDVRAALAAAYRPTDKIAVPFAPIVVNTGAKLILIDTGLGEAAFEKSKGAIGQLTNNLKAAGIARSDIDAVVISHFHQDHIDGVLGADGKPAFPNAEILVPEVEYRFWMDDGEMSRATKGRMEGLFRNNRRIFAALGGKITRYAWDKEIVPGLLAVGTPGHSTGHTSFVLSSGASKVFVQSDVSHVPELFVRHPNWHGAVDQIPDMAEATRRRVYDMLVADKMPVQGFHYPFPALAHVEKTADGYREILVPWSPVI